MLHFCNTVKMNKVVEINERGALTLPKELREQFGWLKGGQAVIRVTDEGILISPGAAFPIEIYTEDRLKEFAKDEAKLAKYKLR